MDMGKADEGCAARFVVTSHFGNEEIGSLLRVELHATQELVPLLEWCRTAPDVFTARQARRAARSGDAPDGPRLPFSKIAAALRTLCHNGFCAVHAQQ